MEEEWKWCAASPPLLAHLSHLRLAALADDLTHLQRGEGGTSRFWAIRSVCPGVHCMHLLQLAPRNTVAPSFPPPSERQTQPCRFLQRCVVLPDLVVAVTAEHAIARWVNQRSW
eukprot:gene13287-biopygen6504